MAVRRHRDIHEQGGEGEWGRERRRKKEGRREGEYEWIKRIAARPSPSDVLPPARVHLLKFPLSFQTEPPTGNQVFRYMRLWGGGISFLTQTTT